jgi:hypothetical protein
MSQGLEFLQGPGAHPLGGRIRGNPFRVPGFQVLQFPQQPVVLGVGDLRIVQDVVAVIVVVKLTAEVFDTLDYV